MSEAPFIAAKIGDDCLAAEDCVIFDSLFVPKDMLIKVIEGGSGYAVEKEDMHD